MSFVLIFWSSEVFNFLLVILGVFKFKKWGMCLSSYELWKFFVFLFWNSKVFSFFLVILGVFKFFVWSFKRGAMGYFCFFLWTLKVFSFGTLKFWNLYFLLIILGFSIFCVKFHKQENKVYVFLSCELWRFFILVF
jgi:hypothetical protein